MRGVTSLRRSGLLAASGILLVLFVRFGIDAAASIPVLRTVREVDPDGSVSSVSFTGGLVLIEDLELPRSGLLLERTAVYFSGGIFSPSVDSIVVLGGRWAPSGAGGSRREPGEVRSIPPCRFSGLTVISGNDTSMVCGTVSSGPGMRYAAISMEGNWGSLRGTIFSDGSLDSACVDWFCMTRTPGDIIPVPDHFRGLRLEGAMTAARRDHLLVRGRIVSVDGDPSEIDFVMDDSGGSTLTTISSRLENIREVLVSGAGSILGGAYVEMRPSGSISLEFVDMDTLGIEVRASLDSVRVFTPALSEDTVLFSSRIDFRGLAVMEGGKLMIDSGLVTIGQVPLRFSMRGRFTGEPRIEIELWSPSVDGETLSRSLPEGLMGRLSGLEMSGSASIRMDAVLDWGCPDSSDFHASIEADGLNVRYSPVAVGHLRYGGSCVMRDSWGESRVIHLDTLDNPGFVVFDSLHPSFEGLLRCAEDATFRTHDGFCEYHIRNSIRANMESGRFVRGGSTITMQLARNLFLGREKTLARKVQEVFLTWRLESYLSKDRMLEIYANIVELGPGVFGFDQAARYYFGTGQRGISTRQMAYLVSILPGPRLYHRHFAGGSVPDHWEAYLDRLIRISGDRGWIDRDSAASALRDSVVFAGSGRVF